MAEKPLTELSMDEEGEIVSLNGGRGFQARLRALGLAEGQRIRKLSRVGFGGPVIVSVNRAQVAIGRGMACKIIVRSTNSG
jgi:ferrous iron transport protein A